MFQIRPLHLVLGLIAALPLCAQTAAPTATQVAARTLVAGDSTTALDLSAAFSSDQVVQFETVKGRFNAELLANDAPKNVANFLSYVNNGSYLKTLIHRSVPGFVIQGGGYRLNGTSIDPVTAQAAVQNEFKLSNVRGTIAMAKTDAGPNTATSHWFINLADNSASLDTTNGGYTVFGRVLGDGMTVVDALAAVPVYNASSQLGSADFASLPLLNNSLTTDNLVLTNIRKMSTYPDASATPSTLQFTVSSSNTAVVAANVAGSTLMLKPAAAGTANITVRATNLSSKFTESTFAVTVAASPLVTTQPANKSLQPGDSFTLSVNGTGTPAVQWQRNGLNLSGATGASIQFTDFQPASAGLFTAVATANGASTTSNPAIVGTSTLVKITAGGSEVQSNVTHPNGKVYDQVLLQSSAAAFTSEYNSNQVTRMSFIDLDNDIVQVEYAGPGTVTVFLDSATGPAVPVNYNQPTVQYMKGHAGIVITGANENSNISVFSVGRATAFDPTGAYNFLQSPSATNDPAKNGSSLFVGHANTAYDAAADIAFIAISSTNGKFGGIRAANTRFWHNRGFTGVYAPGVAFQGPVYVFDINAYDAAKPVLMIGSATGETRITGGGLVQPNHQPIQVSGLTQLKFTAGQDSAGNALSAQVNHAVLLQNDLNVTSQIVVNPQ